MNLVRYSTEETIQNVLEGTEKHIEPEDGRLVGDFRTALQGFRGGWIVDLGSHTYVGCRWFRNENEPLFGVDGSDCNGSFSEGDP